MRPGGGKSKGSSYELEVGKTLSLWISKGERKDLICRTVGSGAQFTATKLGKPGDLMAQDELAIKFFSKYVVECKFWKNLELIKFLYGEGELYQALLKVKGEADINKKFWWLVAKQNHRPDLLFMPAECVAACHMNGSFKVKFHAIFDATVYMYRLKDFLTTLPVESVLYEQSDNLH